MKLTYVGPHDGVDVPLPDGSEPTVKHGESRDFPEEIAASLLEQGDNWNETASEKALDAPPTKKGGAE